MLEFVVVLLLFVIVLINFNFNCHTFLMNNKQKLLKIQSIKLNNIYSKLKSGDIFLTCNTKCNIINAIQNAFVHTRFTHCGIICEIDGIKYIFESYGSKVFNDSYHYGFYQAEKDIKSSGVIMSPLITRINNTNLTDNIVVICHLHKLLNQNQKKMIEEICLAARENVEYPTDFNFMLQYITSALKLSNADTYRKMSKLHCYQFVSLVLDLVGIIPGLYNKPFSEVERIIYDYVCGSSTMYRITNY